MDRHQFALLAIPVGALIFLPANAEPLRLEGAEMRGIPTLLSRNSSWIFETNKTSLILNNYHLRSHSLKQVITDYDCLKP